SSLCSLLGYSRQGLYKALLKQQQCCYQEELVVQQVHQFRKQQKRLGGRKLHFLLEPFMKHHSIGMGRDALFNLLAQHQLLVRKRRNRKPVTTNSYHWYKKYKNLVREFIPTAPNQLWVSDITYITLNNSFAYLSLITDAYSRKIVGFFLSRTLEAKGSIKALQMALQYNPNLKTLIHHSDRGIQYCCNDYISILNRKRIKISMTENGDPLENAIAERVNGILKDELLQNKYKHFEEAQEAVAVAVSVYNHQRPHSSISYKMQQEVHLSKEVVERKWKNYYKKYTAQNAEISNQ
ncbi:MAG: IS3 family transposase, partial [Chitinophagaceae bacterium]